MNFLIGLIGSLVGIVGSLIVGILLIRYQRNKDFSERQEEVLVDFYENMSIF